MTPEELSELLSRYIGGQVHVEESMIPLVKRGELIGFRLYHRGELLCITLELAWQAQRIAARHEPQWRAFRRRSDDSHPVVYAMVRQGKQQDGRYTLECERNITITLLPQGDPDLLDPADPKIIRAQI